VVLGITVERISALVATKIKICGITRYEDARIAAGLGVDALGFIFYPKSPRYIAPADAREIIRKLPAFVTKVGIFVNEPTHRVVEIAHEAQIGAVQLHGNESPEQVAEMPLPVIKAFGVDQQFDLRILDEYKVSSFLLDTWADGSSGGTGKVFDWRTASRATLKSTPLILAGGLGPSNLSEALEQVHPYAVDVNSGVEISPGRKNPRKMRDAIRIVREFEQ